jgi:protein O-mannosyl-transferase
MPPKGLSALLLLTHHITLNCFLKYYLQFFYIVLKIEMNPGMSTINTGIYKYSKYFLPAILTALFLLYAQSFSAKFVFLDDDAIVLDGYTRISSMEKIIPSFSHNYLGGHYYRPLTNVTYIFNAVVSGKTPWSYHAGNILLHALTVIILFYLLIKLGYSKTTILPTVLLFALSSLQLNAVAWIAGRADLLIGLFSLSAFLLFLKYQTTQRWYLFLPISTLLPFAFFSKESALLMPFLILGYYFTRKRARGTGAKYFLFFAFIFFLMVFYFQLRFLFTGTFFTDKIVLANLAATIGIIPETLFKFFIPFGIKVLPDFSPILSWAGTVLFVFFLILPFIQNKINRKIYYFGFFWFVVLMIPGMLFKPNLFDKFYYWDCRSYLPSVGLVIMLAETLRALFKDSFSIGNVRLFGIYFVIIFTCSTYSLHFYNNSLTFWNSVESDYPERFLPHMALYKYYVYANDPEKAEYHFAKAVELNPADTLKGTSLHYYCTGY